MAEIVKKGRGHTAIKIGSRISVPNDYFEDCTREEKYMGTVIKFAGVGNEFNCNGMLMVQCHYVSLVMFLWKQIVN